MLVRLKTDREAYAKGLILSRQAPSDEGLESTVWRDKVSDFVIEFYFGDVWEADKAEKPENFWEQLWDKAENGTAEETSKVLNAIMEHLAVILGEEASEIAQNPEEVISDNQISAEKPDLTCESNGIYILSNPAFRDYSMVICSNDIDSTLKTINSAVPFEYEVFAVYRANSTIHYHDFLETFLTRVRDTDFYDISCEQMYEVFKGIAGISGTMHLLSRKQADTASESDFSEKPSISEENPVKSEISASDSRKNKKKPFSFAECGIPVGAEIEFIDDPSEKAVVATDKKVEYKGKLFSLTGLAKELVGTDNSIQGPYYFSYNGVRLTEVRSNRDNATDN